ncbi:hypothetical protein CPB85DRAFT_400221 [Mucidula mucida]|nr:hypothetical protein CPB85DRAFT_400221 [Mucidula mucida]
MQAPPPLFGDGNGCYRIHVTGNSGTVHFLQVQSASLPSMIQEVERQDIYHSLHPRICEYSLHRPRWVGSSLRFLDYRTSLWTHCSGSLCGNRRRMKNSRQSFALRWARDTRSERRCFGTRCGV